MSQSRSLKSVSEAATRFAADIIGQSPGRVEVKVTSGDGMPLLCAVEEVLGQALPRRTAQELVWLSGAPKPGVHLLQLQAFGPDNRLLGEAVHEFPA